MKQNRLPLTVRMNSTIGFLLFKGRDPASPGMASKKVGHTGKNRVNTGIRNSRAWNPRTSKERLKEHI